jgi:AraC family transcriptional regulator of adaptative response/methylated-DNA-[protein]-cysteine methyltransferase
LPSKKGLLIIFKRWAGISPVQFLQFLTLDYAKQKLAESRSLLETALEAGLSGPSCLHDLFVTFEAMTPGEFKKMGAGLKISYGFGYSPFGECLLAITDRGLCHLGFVEGGNRSGALERLKQAWPGAVYTERRTRIHSIANNIFSTDHASELRPFHLHLKGTNFQVNVWRARREGCKLPGRSSLYRTA